MPGNPALSWGFGMSPVLKDRPHSMLAVAWGPIIQLAVLIDHEENDQPFIIDGYYIVHVFDMGLNPKISRSLDNDDIMSFADEEEKQEGGQPKIAAEGSPTSIFQAFTKPETSFIEAVYFLSDSTLMIILSG